MTNIEPKGLPDDWHPKAQYHYDTHGDPIGMHFMTFPLVIKKLDKSIVVFNSYIEFHIYISATFSRR